MPTTFLDKGIKFDPNRKYFFDTNVWLAITTPQFFGVHGTEIYAWAYDTIRNFKSGGNAPSNIIITPMVVSEYINSRLRLCYKSYRESEKKIKADSPEINFKQYREKETSDYKKQLKLILSDVKDILGDAVLQGDVDSSSGVLDILGRMEKNNLDVNDSFFCETCLRDGYVLITHDKDYKGLKLDILSTNLSLVEL